MTIEKLRKEVMVINLHRRIKTLEKSALLKMDKDNPFNDWTDEELNTAIDCLINNKIFPPLLQQKRRIIQWPTCELSSEELSKKLKC